MQLVQYINLVRSDSTSGGSQFGDSYVTNSGKIFPWISVDEFEDDYAAGHGTHTAGSAVGATLSTPATLVNCTGGTVMGCVGGCIDANALSDDLVSSVYQWSARADLDRLCPAFDCDGQDDAVCLGADMASTLSDHGGMARGAKLAVFDVFYGDYAFGPYLAGNGMWEPSLRAGAKLHSNSWGADLECMVDPGDVLYDDFMYKVSIGLKCVLKRRAYAYSNILYAVKIAMCAVIPLFKFYIRIGCNDCWEL